MAELKHIVESLIARSIFTSPNVAISGMLGTYTCEVSQYFEVWINREMVNGILVDYNSRMILAKPMFPSSCRNTMQFLFDEHVDVYVKTTIMFAHDGGIKWLHQ